MLSDRNEKSEGFTKAEAGRVENMRFNRYRDVNPYDHSRVVLNGERAATDYINASLVKVRSLSPTGLAFNSIADNSRLLKGHVPTSKICLLLLLNLLQICDRSASATIYDRAE